MAIAVDLQRGMVEELAQVASGREEMPLNQAMQTPPGPAVDVGTQPVG
jgi:hypothetical protein